MFELGGLEILVIGIVALIVLGPDKLPEVALKASRGFNRLKRGWIGIQRQIFTEIAFKEEDEKLNKQSAKDETNK